MDLLEPKKPRLFRVWAFKIKSGNVLLSHTATVQYHRRWRA